MRCAILGSGNIGTDLMIKLLNAEGSPLELVALVGIDPKSDGLARARKLGIDGPHEGPQWILDHSDDIDMVFDAKVDEKVYAHMEDISGLIGHYAHGNEPSHHVGYLYNFAGAPWKTQQRLGAIVGSQYGITPQGLSGNDDLGQMSAWLVFTGMGFYPVAPGSNEYVIGRPFVDKAVMTQPNGKVFTIRADKLSDKNVYIGSVTLNGKPLARSFLRHDDITAGGELVFTMQATPNKQWGSAIDARPYTQTPY